MPNLNPQQRLTLIDTLEAEMYTVISRSLLHIKEKADEAGCYAAADYAGEAIKSLEKGLKCVGRVRQLIVTLGPLQVQSEEKEK